MSAESEELFGDLGIPFTHRLEAVERHGVSCLFFGEIYRYTVIHLNSITYSTWILRLGVV